MGLRTLQKVERIVREEMNRAGALELVMPVVQPAELWQESGRWTKYGPELLRLKDRHERDFVAGPTHEEVITDIARRELQSYRQLPVNFYQIQTKFRDEIRPRFGVMRAREFIMKDAYSFHRRPGLARRPATAPCTTPTRASSRASASTFRAVRADSGAIGGRRLAGIPRARRLRRGRHRLLRRGRLRGQSRRRPPRCRRASRAPRPREALRKVATPGARTIADLARFLKVRADALREDAHRRGP